MKKGDVLRLRAILSFWCVHCGELSLVPAASSRVRNDLRWEVGLCMDPGTCVLMCIIREMLL